jgi:predicted metalloprotease with PDZ domain
MARVVALVLHYCLLAAAGTVWAATYTVHPLPQRNGVEVTVSIAKPSIRFRMPAWAPGDYRIVNFGTNLTDVRFFRDGTPVPSEKDALDPNLWRVSDGADEVRYVVAGVKSGIFSENLRVNSREVFAQWPAVLGWFEGHANEEHTLRVRALTDDSKVEIALRAAATTDSGYFTFSAPDYDSLIDAPMVMGPDIRVHPFIVGGKSHAIVGFGRGVPSDLSEYASLCSRIVGAALRLMGELPYERYLFLLDFNGPGGGLEHMNSARLAMPPGVPPRATARFLAHEFFHLYNVKRIRPKPLGPFDYTKPAITGSLWWLEGVTDYYAEVLLLRAGIYSPDEFLDEIGRALNMARRSRRVSLDEASRRVWEANNSAGYGVDYYTGGKAVGALLDLAIRAASAGARSLDDVLLALYKETGGGKPGFAEGRIRELCMQYGGASLGDIYDRCVMVPGPLPIEEVLPKMGLEFRNGLTRASGADSHAARLLDAWLQGG